MFKEFIKDINRILIVGHMRPDPDAYSSVLLLGQLIKFNFPKKEVVMLLDTKAMLEKLSFLRGFDNIEQGDLVTTINKYDSDLVVFVDGNNYKMFTNDINLLKEVLKSKKTALFDHHQEGGESFDYKLIEDRFSCTDVIFENLVKKEGWIAFPEYEEIYLVGVLSDSNRFYYKMSGYRDTFNNVADILDKGYSIRSITDKISTYSKDDILIFNILSRHITYKDNYVYSYITREEYKNEIRDNISEINYKIAKRSYIDNILNNIEGVDFSYILTPSKYITNWSGSIRSKLDTIDCNKFAKYYDGGGHVTGAGFSIVAENINTAIQLVNSGIDKYKDDIMIKI